ncbi:MAG: carbohydrate ABC transporter permease [Candidatus Caldatribacterium sp.]|nr:carbohydrate ABC transporter permease [Candidatus Caldatribacterium sp.]
MKRRVKGKQRRRRLFVTSLFAFLLVLVTVLFLAPTLWMVSTSLKPKAEVFEPKVRWIPKTPTMDNYVRAFALLPLVTLTLVLTCFCDILAAYAFARLRFRGRELLYALVLFTIMVPIYSSAVPLYRVIRAMGLIDTKTGIVLPQAAEAIGVFLLTQFFRSIPKELSEAAKMDGANEWTILWRIVVPLAKPAVAVLLILTFANTWNSFFWPLIVAQSNASITFPVGMGSVMSGFHEGAEAREYGLVMATSVIACLPTVVAFLILQRRFVEGISMSGLKG